MAHRQSTTRPATMDPQDPQQGRQWCLKSVGRGFESHPGQSFSLPLCGGPRANDQMGSHGNFSALLLTLQNYLDQGSTG